MQESQQAQHANDIQKPPATYPSATTQIIPVLQVQSLPPACRRQLHPQAQAQTAQTAPLLWVCQVLQHHLLHLLLML
jgi:hypothetical protein